MRKRIRPLRWIAIGTVAVTLLFVLAVRSTPATIATSGAGSSELVVLVHGMGRSSLSMWPLARSLERGGYDVFNWGYSSTCCGVAQLGGKLASDLSGQRVANYDKVHFVGHSLGTVIIRWMLANDTAAARRGRVVMLAPPNQGSHKADLTANRLGRVLKPLPELRTAPTSTARVLAVPSTIEIGVVAGKYDGKVSVAETHLAGERAHIVVPARHTFLMVRRDVRDLTIRFLRTGSFDGSPASF